MDTAWIESLLNAGANAYSTVKTADALKHQQAAADGSFYTNGEFGSQAQNGAGISPVVLLLGGAALFFVLLKD